MKIHDGFGCTIRSIPWRWIANGFRAFDNLFYNRNSIAIPRKERGCLAVFGRHGVRVFKDVVSLPPFHVVFQESNIHMYKKREIGGQIVVNLGICHHFYNLTLKNEMIKQCSSSIFWVSEGWDECFFTLFIIFKAKKFPKSHF